MSKVTITIKHETYSNACNAINFRIAALERKQAECYEAGNETRAKQIQQTIDMYNAALDDLLEAGS